MPSRSQPAWPLPILALGQLWIGSALLSPLEEPGTSWDLSYAVLATMGSLAGLALLALALRNCARLWRMSGEASWAVVVSTVLVAAFAALVASGPVTSGVWRWWSPVLGGFSVYLVVVLVREIRRLQTDHRQPSE